jgi:hypothetical protein
VPHYCRLCGRRRANERFSGGGHRIHVCRDCQRLPKDERRAIEARLEIEGFLSQSHISNKNLDRLREHTRSPDPTIVKAAGVVLQVAAIAPYKRKRLRALRRVQPDLIATLVDLGLEDSDDLEYDTPEPAAAAATYLRSENPAVYRPLYLEFAAEDRELAELGMADYALGLEAEDEA